MKVNLLNYIEKDSVVHRLSGTTKFICFLILSFASIITYDIRVILLLLVLSFTALKVSKIKIKEVKYMFSYIVAFLIINFILLYIFNPNYGPDLYNSRTVLFHIAGNYDVTLEQLFYQLNVSSKYFIALPLAVLFISTTNPSEFASSLNSLRVPYKICYSIALALRYIPDIQKDYIDISKSEQARGIELGKGARFHKRFINAAKILLPLILLSISRIDTISNAMELRCFGKNKKRTWYKYKKMNKNDYICIFICVLLFILTLVMIKVDGSRFFNPFM